MSPNHELTLGAWRRTEFGRDSHRLRVRSSVHWRPDAGACTRTWGDALTESNLPQSRKQRQAGSRLHDHFGEYGSIIEAAIPTGTGWFKRRMDGRERSRTTKNLVIARRLPRRTTRPDDDIRSLFESFLVANLRAVGLQETSVSNQTSDGFQLEVPHSKDSSDLSPSSTRLGQQIVRDENVSI